LANAHQHFFLGMLVGHRVIMPIHLCLLNLYHNGEEGMGWHSDDEKSIVPNSSIASLSFGAGRKFSLKHKENKQNIALILEGGSLLEMKGETQKYWQHYLPKSKKILKPRINLTFRKMMA
ncbi:MAG: alpha-ketoglutarate-dependent dioxygenase AlkB, partial [Bacteroidetes bacterium]|nr:alpha-ketoglutarate-dependent dioxygenase AlkB [Bacteroidota bacterium]MBU1761365.1 alpha-ketoglutarate-dependent dioxygenase AlkB [Bacteroidota bacterium]